MPDQPILYVNPLSSFANKCVIALDEKGVAFERRIPAGFGTGTDDPAHLAANPFGEVPTLVHEGQTIFESSVIFDYIDTRWPEPRLMPAEAAQRARSLMIQSVMSARYDPITWGLTELVRLGRVSGAGADRVTAFAKQQAKGLNAWLTEQLGASDWFEGDHFGAADIFAAPHLMEAAHLMAAAQAGLLAPAGPLTAWLARAVERPSVAAVRQGTAAFMAAITPADAARWAGIPRQYRDTRLEWVIRAAGIDVLTERLASGGVFLSRDLAAP
jgi:glutathione S-transferase